MVLLSVRATAQLLGVHENTVRHWEERKLLHAVRLPGSGFRRFPKEGVMALVKQMQGSLAHHPAEPGESEEVFTGGAYDTSLAEQD